MNGIIDITENESRDILSGKYDKLTSAFLNILLAVENQEKRVGGMPGTTLYENDVKVSVLRFTEELRRVL